MFEHIARIAAKRHALAGRLRQLVDEHTDYMIEAYTLFCKLYR